MACCFGGRRKKAAAAGAAAGDAGRRAAAAKAADGVARVRRAKELELPGCDAVRVLGEGTFGTVVLVRERSTGVLFAAKVMSKAQLQEGGQFANIITERRVLREAGPHPFVVECHSGFQTRDAVVLVLEYLAGGDMFDLLKLHGCLSEAAARFYIAEILIGLQELHRLNFVFRDLKLENILLDHRGHVRLTDFGLSGCVRTRAWDDRTITDISGTAIYQAPEILANAGHGRAVDFWALGVLVHVVLTGRPPFSAPDRVALVREIRTADVELDANPRLAHCSPAARDLIRRLLCRDPAQRLGAADDHQAEVRAHPFFEGVDWDAMLKFEVAPPLPPAVPSPGGSPLPPGGGSGSSGGELPASGNEAERLGGTPASSAGQDVSVHGGMLALDAMPADATGRVDAEKRVFDKLVTGKGKEKRGKKKAQGTDALDVGEYKVVDVGDASSATPGRVSIGLDFQGKSDHAGVKTWTGTTDDFGRFIAEDIRSPAG